MAVTAYYKKSRAPYAFGAFGVFLLAVAFVATLVLGSPGSNAQAADRPSPATTVTVTPTPTPADTAACEPQYAQYLAGAPEGANNADGQVVSDFEIRYADTLVAAGNITDAQRTLLIEEGARNAQALAAWAYSLGLNKDPNAWKSLVDGACLSSEGKLLHARFEGALSASGTTFEEAEAPADAYNSGVNGGVYGVASEAGIRGDRKAIKVTLKDGSVMYIMVRCGNPVYPGKPNLPEVPTDNPPPPPAPVCEFNSALPPDSPNCVKPKDPAADPGPRGNAPVGGGKNADPGPGTYIPPAQMEQPPSTPRVNPAPPPPAPPAAPAPGPAPAPVPTKDPAPPPAPEPSAPATPDPPACIIPPGKTTC